VTFTTVYVVVADPPGSPRPQIVAAPTPAASTVNKTVFLLFIGRPSFECQDRRQGHATDRMRLYRVSGRMVHPEPPVLKIATGHSPWLSRSTIRLKRHSGSRHLKPLRHMWQASSCYGAGRRPFA